MLPLRRHLLTIKHLLCCLRQLRVGVGTISGRPFHYTVTLTETYATEQWAYNGCYAAGINPWTINSPPICSATRSSLPA